MRKPRFPEAVSYAVKRQVVTGQNDLGEDIVDWQGTETINAEVQPLSGDMTRGEMGVTAKSTHKGFSLGTFESNTRIVAGAETYLVGYVSNWGSHYQAILEKVT